MPDLQGPTEPANVTWAPKSSVAGDTLTCLTCKGQREHAIVTWAPKSSVTEDPFHIFKIILVLNYLAGRECFDLQRPS